MKVTIFGAGCVGPVTEELLRAPIILDGRNLYDPALMERLGIQYFAIGRGRSLPVPGRLAAHKPLNVEHL